MMLDRERWISNDRLLGGIAAPHRLQFEDLVKGLERWGWKPRVMETRRSLVRQVWLLARGATRTLKSKHISGRAMDLIDARYQWADTPLEFTVDLMILAEGLGLLTGALFGLTVAEKVERTVQARSGMVGALKLLLQKRIGWDRGHIEVP